MSATELQQPNAKDAKQTRRTQSDSVDFAGDFSHEIIGAAVEVQRVLGPGLLESAYAGALAVELNERGLRFEREVPVSGRYKGRELGVAYRADFIVESSVIVELKASEVDVELCRAQLLSYLRVAGLKLGLMINFHTVPVVKGVHRLVNKL